MCANKVVILIPIYKKTLHPCEIVSLRQVKRVLHRYKMFFLAPESLVVDYGGLEDGIEFVRYPDEFFCSKNSYSAMMLDVTLYEYFIEYEYMLVYQLDAFVFSDCLLKFCNMGYDYIGAPMRRANFRTFWHREADWQDIKCYVGNGGLSLRNITKCITVLKQKEYIFSRKPECWSDNRFLEWEDLFFAYSSTFSDLDFTVPDYKTALSFSVGADVAHVYQRMPEWLPFGCHAWYAIDYWHWKPIIEKQGYSLPDLTGLMMYSSRYQHVRLYVVSRYGRKDQNHLLEKILSRFLNNRRSVVIWGWGLYGKCCKNLLDLGGVLVDKVYDKEFSNETYKDDMRFMPIDIDLIKKSKEFVIVSTIKYEDDIRKVLVEYGLVQGEDFVLFSEIAEDLMKSSRCYRGSSFGGKFYD